MTASQNICFFNTTKFWGGGEKWHFDAAVMMTKTKNNVFFVADGEGELAKRLEQHTINQYHISVSNRSFLNPIKINRLIKFYQRNKIDTVIFNSPKDLKLGGKAAKKAKVKNIVYRRGIAVEVKKNKLNESLFRDVVTHFIFNSEATKQLLQNNFSGLFKTKRTAVIYNAIEFPDKEQQLPNNDKTLVIGNVGRLVEQKGQHHLISIAKKLKEHRINFNILIAGEGPLHKSLQEKIDEENLNEQIQLLGFVEDVESFMHKIDIFISTALWEGFGFVLAEAMAVKKPVLAFDLSSNPELVMDGENGFLIPPENIDFFIEKLMFLSSHKSVRIEMGEKGYNFAKNNFQKDIQFNKFLDFIAS